MKEIPILFSTPMVQAILAGRKTLTRRVLKFPNDYDGKAVFNNHPYGVKYSSNEFDGCVKRLNSKWCPGDLLWVRESWQMTGWDFKDGIMTIHYKDGQWLDCMAPEEDGDLWLLNYVERLEKIGCLKQDPNDEERFVFTDKPQPWKPSIHMPKTASRIWLEVTNVRAERLQDMEGATPEECDSIKEGIIKFHHGDGNYGYHWNGDMDGDNFVEPIYAFKDLWKIINGQPRPVHEIINGKIVTVAYEVYPFNEEDGKEFIGLTEWKGKPLTVCINPWVWVVEFKLLSTTGKP